jgi:4-hydroxy-tetrahydrodipicolinate reductase
VSGEQPVRVIQYGIGAAGGEMVRQMVRKQTVRVVGAVDIDPGKIGRDLGEVAGVGSSLGITVHETLEEVLAGCQADLVLHATAPDIPRIVQDVSGCVQAGLNVIAISGILHIKRLHPELHERLDALARQHGVSVLGSGTTPGFYSDTLVTLLAGVCSEVESVNFRRVCDMYEWGPGLYEVFGTGFTPERFRQGVEDGSLGLFDRLLQVHDQLAETFGWEIDDLENRKEFLTAGEPRATGFITVAPGDVCGFRQTVTGKRDGKTKITVEYVGMIRPDRERDGLEIGTQVAPASWSSLTMTLGGEVVDNPNVNYVSVAAHPINGIPHVMAARPGIVSRRELPMFIPLR